MGKFELQKAEIQRILRETRLSRDELARRVAIDPDTMRKIANGYQKASDVVMTSIRNVERAEKTTMREDPIPYLTEKDWKERALKAEAREQALLDILKGVTVKPADKPNSTQSEAGLEKSPGDEAASKLLAKAVAAAPTRPPTSSTSPKQPISAHPTKK